jgi:rhamnosyl/mannosyltransferase
MKVLHVGKFFYPHKGGLEFYMRDTLVEFSRRGVECAALVHQHEAGAGDADEVFREGGAAIRVVRAGVQFNLLFTPFSRSFRRLLERLLDEFRPDVLHLHLPNPSVFWVLASARARAVPWVLQWHSDVVAGTLPMKMAYAAYRQFEKRLLNRAAAVVVSSQTYLEASAPLAGYRDKCHVVPLGIDTARYSQYEEVAGMGPSGPDEESAAREESRPLRILAVGRLTYYKGFRYLLEALARAPGVRLQLVGQGDEEAMLRALAARLELGDRVEFAGGLDDAGLVQALRDCDCLCLPSIERTEAFGVVLLEAMYFGKPILSSWLEGSGMNWIVEDGVTGLKFEPADVDSLVAALRQMAADADARRRMGAAGRAKFEANFSIDRSVDGLQTVYSDLPGPLK